MRIPVREPSGRAFFPRRGRPTRKPRPIGKKRPANTERPAMKARTAPTVAGRLERLRRTAMTAVSGLAGFASGRTTGKRRPRSTARR